MFEDSKLTLCGRPVKLPNMLETSHLLIRPWKDSDAEAFFELTHDEGFLSYPITDWRQPNREAAKSWIEEMAIQVRSSKMGAFAVLEKPGLEIVGMAAIRVLELEKENRPEITYRLRTSAWGRGLATEAARAMLTYGFDSLHMEEIAVSITPDNSASIKVALKLGMTRTGSEMLLGKLAEIYRVKRGDFLSRP